MAENSDKSKYPTWHRTLLRRAKEEEMKRFCKAQVSFRDSWNSLVLCS